ncbi:class I SAM-dependent methyltransferase [Actinomadura rudentiformis]|uniref:class I SAM-dependent methyltransferase n=1 Tax=Actinomadura rudentiformis TaxID=359158 RepID=UPI00178C29C6|nr:class I SAM-dependent methyltransferase [Actinomadura rudentiformis]
MARIYREAAADYDQVGPAFYAANGERLVARVGVAAGEQVLDAGCGRGACVLPAAEAGGRVVGVDLSPEMVGLTRVAAERRGLTSVAVKVGDAQAPEFPEGTFDVVLSGFVLRLLPDPAAALRSYARVLKSGGRFGATIYASTFGAEWEPVRALLESFMAPATTRPPVVELDPAERLAELMSDAGFGEVNVEDEPFDIWLAGPDEWWHYMWASGYRGMMDRIPADRREEARRVACEAADALRAADGRLLLPQTVRYALGVRGVA